MKKALSTLLLICLVAFGRAQNCITVNWSYFDNPSNDNIHWRLLVNWSADGTKHLRTTVTNYGDTVLNECYQVSNGGGGTQSGTITYNITIPTGNVNFVGTFRRFTGTCGNGTECSSAQSLINNVLPIKIMNVSAKNVGNTTEVKFRIESVDGDNLLTLNMFLKNGTKKVYKIQMPDNVIVGQNWKIVIDNITEKYTLIKL
jgi:hypothetical protein